MDTSVLVALISLVGSAVGTLGGILVTSKLTTYRIEQLEKQVAKHNNLVERTYLLEQRTEVQAEQLKVVNHRLEDIEQENAKFHRRKEPAG